MHFEKPINSALAADVMMMSRHRICQCRGSNMSRPQPPPGQTKGRETILGLFTCFFKHWWAQVL